MPSTDLYDRILKHIEAETIGVIWFSSENLDSPTEIHNVFNYIVDGHLAQFAQLSKEHGIETSSENNFFISNNFKSPFIVFNSSIDKKFSNKDFEDFKMILEKLDTQHEKNLAVVYPKGFTIPAVIKKSKFAVKELTY